MLVGTFEIHHGVVAAVDLAPDALEARKMHGVFEHEGMGRAGIEPDVADVVDLFPWLVGVRAKEALARAVHVPGIGAFGFERVGDAPVDGLVLQDFGCPVAVLAHEHRDRHAPGALPRDHPVGTAGDHAGDAVLTLRRHPLGDRDGVQCAGAQRLLLSLILPRKGGGKRKGLVHRDEPLRRVAEDHRFPGAPGVRVLMLEPATRQQHAAFDQRLDDGLVGVALLALVVDDALAFEARCLIGAARRFHRRCRGSWC